MSKKLLVGLVSALAVGALMAVPVVSQANKLPKWTVNGSVAGKSATGVLGIGKILLENADLGNIECTNLGSGSIRNETTEGTEKGLETTEAYTTYNCTAAAKCKTLNFAGKEIEGIFASSEGPPTVESGTGQRTNNTSLPWTGETEEPEPGDFQVLSKNIKVWIVIPPSKGSSSPACVTEGDEILFEGELAPIAENGKKNGLNPSNSKFEGHGKTGKLESPDITSANGLNLGYTTSENSITQIGQKVQLVNIIE